MALAGLERSNDAEDYKKDSTDTQERQGYGNHEHTNGEIALMQVSLIELTAQPVESTVKVLCHRDNIGHQ
jgi:hypothetical protein